MTFFFQDMNMQKYKAPNIMAHFINQELKMKKDAIILDVGCGTGLLGVQVNRPLFRLLKENIRVWITGLSPKR